MGAGRTSSHVHGGEEALVQDSNQAQHAAAAESLLGDFALTDLIAVEVLQEIQDAFAEATGVASVITSTDGQPITRPSRFCRLCQDIVRQTEKGLRNCQHSDAVLGRPNPDGPVVQPCLSSGLWDAGAGIFVGKRHLANWLIGQVRNEETDDARILGYAREIGADEGDFVAAYREVTVMSTEQFRLVARTLFLMANQLSEQAHQRAVLAVLLERSRRDGEAQMQLQRLQRFESIGVLAGGVAHEFNNCLMSIMGNVELATLELPADSPVQAFLAEAMQAAQRSAELCRQMLAYAGRTPMQVALVDVSCMLRESSSLLQVTGKGQTRVDVVLPPSCPMVRADSREIQQVVMNLVTNAMEAVEGPQATVSVSVRTVNLAHAGADEFCFVGELPVGKYVAVRVEDNGCGMPPAVLERAFDPFFSTKFYGRGLGLAASLGIAHAHSGSISLKSQEGKGTVAELLLPVASGKTLPPEEPAPPSAGAENGDNWQGGGSILVIDDEAVVRDVAGKMLERAGFKVYLAETGSQGIERFQTLHQQLSGVLLDWAMPGLDGSAVLRELHRIDPAVPVVLATGFSQAEVAEKFSLAEFRGIIHKPYSYQRLRETMRIALGRA
ncbi:MAG: PocR ligand-binding domain-containing protein [Lentisphaeria bacterium]|jgi:signal transduction histidine kinase/CheY-like chemotaxis protein|nr:PocR ligand-binding domain-containing protein [Lentisphaeria bacterium]